MIPTDLASMAHLIVLPLESRPDSSRAQDTVALRPLSDSC